MPPKTSDTEEDRNFEALYRSNYEGLLRYATVILNSHGSNDSSVSGRAEEAVQEMFAFAWENREKLFSHASPVGWLYKCLYYKALGLLKEDAGFLSRNAGIWNRGGCFLRSRPQSRKSAQFPSYDGFKQDPRAV